MRKLMMGLGLLVSLMMFGLAQAFDGPQEGDDYALISPAVSMGQSDKVQVVELFWYGCPACYRLEPHLKDWLKNKPEHVEFIRLPAIFNNPVWRLHAKAYYTAEALDVVDAFHEPFFHSIHQFGKRMASDDEIRAFFVSIGVEDKAFDNAFASFAVESKVRRAADLTGRFNISGVPSLAINGKFVVDGPMAKSYENMFNTVNVLAAREAGKVAQR